MEKPRRSSVEVGMTEVRKNFPVDRRISRNPSPEVEENTRSQIPDDGEVVKPAVEDDVPGGSSILYDRWLLKRRRGEVDRWRGLVGGNRISWARRDRRKGWSRDEIRRGGGNREGFITNRSGEAGGDDGAHKGGSGGGKATQVADTTGGSCQLGTNYS
jgi:hypothetical protein